MGCDIVFGPMLRFDKFSREIPGHPYSVSLYAADSGLFFVQHQKTQFRIFKNSDVKIVQELSFCPKTQFQSSQNTWFSDNLYPKSAKSCRILIIRGGFGLEFWKTQFQKRKNSVFQKFPKCK